jgi:hypothetical protein
MSRAFSRPSTSSYLDRGTGFSVPKIWSTLMKSGRYTMVRCGPNTSMDASAAARMREAAIFSA